MHKKILSNKLIRILWKNNQIKLKTQQNKNILSGQNNFTKCIPHDY